jgi:hypothetical protein
MRTSFRYDAIRVNIIPGQGSGACLGKLLDRSGRGLAARDNGDEVRSNAAIPCDGGRLGDSGLQLGEGCRFLRDTTNLALDQRSCGSRKKGIRRENNETEGGSYGEC